MKFTQVVLLPMGCPINESNNMAVQRRNTDRQTDGHFFQTKNLRAGGEFIYSDFANR